MSNATADQVAAKWKRNLVASIPTIKEGVESVTTSPMEQAARQKSAYVAGVQRAADSGAWEAGLRSVSLQDWKDAMLKKGTQRIAAGVEGASAKVTAFMQQLLPFTRQVSKEIDGMPKGTLEDGIARSTAAIRKMAEFKYRRNGG